jgi:16S rRNA (uracil1498-N3)-methyltransferase
MSVPVFRIDRDQLAGRRAGAAVRLDGPEGRHAALVRRLRPGERLDLTDGAGLLAECSVAAVDGAALDLGLLALRAVPAPRPRITVVQALAKGDRGETAVETMTEIGVDAVVPWAASRSITQWRGDRGEKALAKWRSTAAEAAKQSRRAWWPEIAQPATTAQVAKLLASATLPVVLHEEAAEPLAGLDVPARTADGGPAEVVLVVGPEGGIAPDELRAFAEAGARACLMGPTVLRTSTAGTAAAAVLLARCGRWS